MKKEIEKIIVDGDWGGDEMQLFSVLLAHPEKCDVLGVTSVFGNTTHDNVLKNSGRILRFFNEDQRILRYPGQESPIGEVTPDGDGAHGDDGVGGVKMDLSNIASSDMLASDFILDQLATNPSHTITITATGPLSNIAKTISQDIKTMRRVKNIYVMGGCTAEIPACDMSYRQGNITPFAEFNFQQAPSDAQVVMSSGLPITLFPMNCTHQLTLTEERADKIREVFSSASDVGETIVALMSAPADLDRMKFNSAPVMHDVNTALMLVRPDMYSGRRGMVNVLVEGEKRGMSAFEENALGNVLVQENIQNSDALFDVVLDSYRSNFSRNLKL